MGQKGVSFDKYEEQDAYHWNMIDPSWSNGRYNPPTEARFRVLEKMLPKKIDRVLDIGCGDGYMLYRIGEVYPNVELYGVDYEERAVTLANEYLKKYRHYSNITQDNVYDLPYGDHMFETVIMTEVIEHLEQPEKALQEVHRVLQKGGKFLVTTPNWQPDIEWDPDYHVHEFRHDELKKVLSNQFDEVRVRACCPMGWMRLWRLHSLYRSIIRAISRLGENPMIEDTDEPTQNFGQLIASCVK